jgi:hypothetical protein
MKLNTGLGYVIDYDKIYADSFTGTTTSQNVSDFINDYAKENDISNINAKPLTAAEAEQALIESIKKGENKAVITTNYPTNTQGPALATATKTETIKPKTPEEQRTWLNGLENWQVVAIGSFTFLVIGTTVFLVATKDKKKTKKKKKK